MERAGKARCSPNSLRDIPVGEKVHPIGRPGAARPHVVINQGQRQTCPQHYHEVWWRLRPRSAAGSHMARSEPPGARDAVVLSDRSNSR